MVKKNAYYLAFITIILLINGCAQKTFTGLTTETNFKQLGINEKSLDRLDSLFGATLVNQYAAGLSVIVAKNGKMFYNKQFGFKNRETKALLTQVDEFRIAAMSKPIISLAAMCLIEKGKLSLDDKVSKYIPQFANLKVINTFNPTDTTYTTQPTNYNITVKQLLTHTAGIGGVNDNRFDMIYKKNHISVMATADKVTLSNNIINLANLPLIAQPATQYFDGLSTDILGSVLEKATGLTLDSVLSQTLFKPLGMVNTYFYLPTSKLNRLTVMYSETEEGKLNRTASIINNVNLNYPISGAKTYLSGGNGLVSTAQDYANFLQLILNKGKFNDKQILSSQSIELATSNQIGNLMADENKFGFGFTLPINQSNTICQLAQYNTYFCINTQKNTQMVLFMQVNNAHHNHNLLANFNRIVAEILENKNFTTKK